MLHAWMPCWLTLLCSRPERAGAAASRNPVEPISVPQRFRDTVLLTYCAKFSESISWDRSVLLAWSALTTFGRVWIWIQWNYILQTDKMILQHFTPGELGMRQFETPMFCSMEPFTLFLSDKGNMKEMTKGLPFAGKPVLFFSHFQIINYRWGREAFCRVSQVWHSANPIFAECHLMDTRQS